MRVCPRCGVSNEFVYIGVIHAECTNTDCPNFTEEAASHQRASLVLSKHPDLQTQRTLDEIWGSVLD